MNGLTPSDSASPTVHRALLGDLRALIVDARQRVAHVANATLAMTYWQVGRRLLTEHLDGERGEYGREILVTVSQELVAEFGQGFSYSALTRMARFATLFPEEAVVASLTRELSWSHFLALFPVNDPLAREFYAEMCRAERWSVRTLRKRIAGMLYERTALSRNSEAVIRRELANFREEGRVTPDLVFRDPYLLDFLGLQDAYSEKDLEAAILRELETFLLELGSGFAFIARQKRISVGRDDFYLDLLFFHRRLRRLVAVELKLESFQPAHTGQMELYLRWLDRNERVPGEEEPHRADPLRWRGRRTGRTAAARRQVHPGGRVPDGVATARSTARPASPGAGSRA
jgi:predicted nuclease of restriction endonuclease-like (RecB) superfamily